METRGRQDDAGRDAYAGFADRHDLFFGDFESHSPRLRAFFGKIFRDSGVKRVLDCTCGTGRHLHLFHNLGFDVVGSDVSPAMLEQARRSLSERGVNIPLRRIDYRELPENFAERFDAVVCLTSAICEMPDPAEILRAFESMRGVLGKGGLLVLSQGTTDKQWAEKPRFILVEDAADFTRLFVVDYFDRGARYNVMDIFHDGGEGRLESWGVDYPHMVFRDGQEALLESAGFHGVEFYGSYAFEPYSKETSDHLITVARAWWPAAPTVGSSGDSCGGRRDDLL